MLLARIKQDLLVSRRNRNTRVVEILSVLIGESERAAKAKEPTDEEVIRTIRKTIEGIDEMLKVRDMPSLATEKLVISEYLPKLMTKDEVVAVVNTLKETGTSLGDVMKHFKGTYAAGSYLAKDVSDAYRGV